MLKDHKRTNNSNLEAEAIEPPTKRAKLEQLEHLYDQMVHHKKCYEKNLKMWSDLRESMPFLLEPKEEMRTQE